MPRLNGFKKEVSTSFPLIRIQTKRVGNSFDTLITIMMEKLVNSRSDYFLPSLRVNLGILAVSFLTANPIFQSFKIALISSVK
jgi:hypothetical protein